MGKISPSPSGTVLLSLTASGRSRTAPIDGRRQAAGPAPYFLGTRETLAPKSGTDTGTNVRTRNLPNNHSDLKGLET